MDEWKQVELADLCTRVTSGGTPARSHPEYYAMQAHGHPWVKSRELRDRYIGATEEQISDLGLQNSAAKLLPPETVLVAMYGATAGRVGLLKIEAALNQAICALVPDRDRVDPVFLFHTLRSQHEALSGKAAGAAQQNLNAGIVKAFPLRVPSVVTQSRIAAVLSAFDELIEINERRIQLLEDLARSLYRGWFMHFRFPGHEDVEFVDSELGRIPEGWCVSRINDVTSNVSRGIAPKYADDGNWTVLNQRCIRNQRVTFALTRRHEGSVSDVKQLRFGDVLINSTGVGTLGRVGMLLDETGRTTVDSHVTIVRPASPDLHPWFGLHLLGCESAFTAMGTGSTGQTELGRAAVGELPILVPPIAVLQAFGDVAWPLLRPMSTLLRCCDSLSATRDLLLPRLVSGKLDISDIDLGVLTPAETE